MRYIIVLLIFGIIVMFHELGHFFVAKKCGIRVNEFCIGMGPKIAGFTRGETVYSIRILPIGGACMMQGEDDGDYSEGAFNTKPVWQRILVVIAGPLFNFIMAFVCAVVIIGMSGYDSTQIVSVDAQSPAAEAGLQTGDVIVKADGSAMHTFTDFRMHLALFSGEPCEVTVERNGERQTMTITPVYDETNAVYRIGITGGQYVKTGIGGTLLHGFYEVKSNINVVVKSLELMIKGKVNKDQVAGPVGMFSMIGSTYEEAAKYGVMTVVLTLLNMILLLSANLGVMNLLPIPALDGGRLVFLVIEAVRGKPVSPEKEGWVHMIGFALLMLLMILVTFNDISRLIAG